GANDRGVAPKVDLPENPARWAGLGKRPGALPLRIVIQIRKIAFVSASSSSSSEMLKWELSCLSKFNPRMIRRMIKRMILDAEAITTQPLRSFRQRLACGHY
ncbi:MAG: hypothetical protein QGF00_16195, partial [Planctomycetota bacterium]|nr:hypothetical protein [Planctomycetota bacterium]